MAKIQHMTGRAFHPQPSVEMASYGDADDALVRDFFRGLRGNVGAGLLAGAVTGAIVGALWAATELIPKIF